MRRTWDWKAAAVVCAAAAAWTVFAATVVNPIVIYDEVLFFVTALSGPDLAAAQSHHAAVLSSGALLHPELVGALARLRLPPEAAAKVLNVVVFVAAAAWLAAKSRRLADGRRAAAVALVILAAPVGTYVAVVMPECLYFALAAAAVAVLLGGDGEEDARPRVRLAGAAALLALATLTKPHGLMLVVALGVALLLRPALRVRRWRDAALDLAAAGAGFAAAFALGHVLVTPPGLARGDLLGPEYRAQLANLGALVTRPAAGLELGLTYAAAVLTLLAPTLAVLVRTVAERRRSAWHGAEGRARLAAAMVLGALALLLATVPVVVAAEPAVIHLRYLDFLFPIALAVAARLSSAERPDLGPVTAGVGAALWAGGALWLAFRLPLLRPLGIATPDLFFLYGGPQEFGRFGLGPWVRPVLLATVLAGAAALASRRVRWWRAQAAVLGVFTLLALPNVWRFDAALASLEAPDRAVGKTARALCGRGADDVVAIGAPTSFVPLYAALYALKRPAPLLLDKTPDAVFSAQLTGRCVLTTLPLPDRYTRLAGSPLVTLGRAR